MDNVVRISDKNTILPHNVFINMINNQTQKEEKVDIWKKILCKN